MLATELVFGRGKEGTALQRHRGGGKKKGKDGKESFIADGKGKQQIPTRASFSEKGLSWLRGGRKGTKAWRKNGKDNRRGFIIMNI